MQICIRNSLTRDFPDTEPLLLTERNAAFMLENTFPEFSEYSPACRPEHRWSENCVRQGRVNINCDFVPRLFCDQILIFDIPVRSLSRVTLHGVFKTSLRDEGEDAGTDQYEIDRDQCI